MSSRAEKRLALDEPARLVPNDWSSVEVRMLECTARDFRARSDVNLLVGAQVTLDVPGLGLTKARVTWRSANQFAAAFEEPIDLSRTGFMSLNREAVLARLLVERAAAHCGGKDEQERELRGRILDGLPVRRIAGKS
jgi:hypothetical protein